MQSGDSRIFRTWSLWLKAPQSALSAILGHWRAIVIVTILGVLVSLALSRRFSPVYQSESILRLRTPSQAAIGESDQVSEEEPSDVTDPMQLVRKIKLHLSSRPILSELAQTQRKRFSIVTKDDEDEFFEWITNGLEIEHRGADNFRITAKTDNPHDSQLVTGFLTKGAVQLHRATYEQRAIAIETYAQQQVRAAADELKQLEDEMVAFLENNPSLTIRGLSSDELLNVEGIDRLRTRSNVLTRSLDKLALTHPGLRDLMNKRKQLQRELNSIATGATPTEKTAITENLAALQQQLDTLRAQGLSADHPEIKALMRQQAELEKKIADAQPSSPTLDTKLQQRIQAELVAVDGQLRTTASKVVQPIQPTQDITALEAQWGNLRRKHSQLSEQYDRLQEVSVNASLKRNLRLYEAHKLATVVQDPTLPTAPTGLTRGLLIAGGVLLSFFAGLGAAIFLALWDDRLKQPIDLQRADRPIEVLAVLASQHRSVPALAAVNRTTEAQLSPTPTSADQSVIRWLKDTDDLDSALALLKPATHETQTPSAQESVTDTDNPLAMVLARRPALIRQSDTSPDQIVPAQQHVKFRSSRPFGPGLFVSVDPHSKAADQMRLLAARLNAQIEHGIRIVAVTSWEPLVGKTTIAANLAMVLAESQRRVLVIDTCNSDANLSNVFGMQPPYRDLYSQLIDWLDGKNNPWEVVQVAETLTIIPATVSPHPRLPLLASEAFTQLLWDMAHLYDALVIDTAALRISSDAVALQRKVNGYVAVVSKNRSTMDGVMKLHQRLNEDTILGVVFNEHS